MRLQMHHLSDLGSPAEACRCETVKRKFRFTGMLSLRSHHIWDGSGHVGFEFLLPLKPPCL